MLIIEQMLQVTIALLVIIGALLLGLGHGNYSLPAMASAAAVISFVVTDRLAIFRLNRIAANVAAVLAAIYSLSDFLASNSESQLFAIASLLIYLQMVLLFQKKSSRIYWQLLVLSLLQVVVAAALYVRVESGFLFSAYMVLALIAMTLTYIHRETSLIQEFGKTAKKELEKRSESPISLNHIERLREPPLILFDAVHQDKRTIRRILKYTLLSGCVALLFGALFFYSIPRMHETWRGPDFNIGSQTGFATTISFNETGLIAESDRVVFRANFVDAETDEYLELNSEVYFRAIVLNTYAKNRGVDTFQFVNSNNSQIGQMGPIPTSPNAGRLPKLRVVMDPNNEVIMFSTYPFYSTPLTPTELAIMNQSSSIERTQQSGKIAFDSYAYELAVDSIRENSQTEFMPFRNLYDGQFTSRMGSDPRDESGINLLQKPGRERQPSIEELADELSENLDFKDHRAIAEKFTRHLRYSGNYRYTLDFRNVPFDRSIDSIEDFISNHQSGHCEYFASALCLMLRYSGIPSRLVVGFRCDEFNALSHRYVVQEKHAHVWVEAYIPPENVTQEMIDSGIASEGGAWMRLDPTPANPDDSDEDFLMAAGDALDLAQMLWDDFMFGYNARQQNSALYSSLFGGSEFVTALFSGEAWDSVLDDTSESLEIEKEQARLLIQGLIILVVLVSAGSYWAYRKFRKKPGEEEKRKSIRHFLGVVATLISPRLGRWVSGPEDDNLVGPRVDFYEKTAQLLGASGFHRSPSQTHTEFIEHVIEKIQKDSHPNVLATVLRSLLGMFYSVRFGNHPLTDSQQVNAQQLVGSLEKELKILQTEAGTNSP